MRSPILAILWENWRLTRLEVACRLALGIIGGAAVLSAFAAVAPSDAAAGTAASTALNIVIMANFPIWQSIAKLTGGRFMEGYRPGFPFHLLYARPVPTAVLVGVPMAYDALSSAALFLASTAVLGVTFGYAFPLLSLGVWIWTLHLLQAAAQWTTRNRVVQWLGAGGACGLLLAYGVSFGERWPMGFELSPGGHAALVLIGLASFGLTVAGVARQRHGDARAAVPRKKASGFADSFVSLFGLPCPTSSPAYAQVWFDAKSSGLPLLTIGLAFALAIPLLFALGGPLAFVRPFAVMLAGVSVLAVLLLGGNAFGIRRKHGSTYSAFEATQAYETAQLAAIKVIVRTVCVLAALVAVGASVWASLSLASGWEKFAPGMLKVQGAIAAAFDALTGYQLASLVVVACIGLGVMVALRATLAALHARYPRPLMMAGALLLLYVLALVLLTLADPREIGFEIPMGTILRTTLWIVVAGVASATVYLFARVLAERLMSLRQAGSAVLISAVFVAAWLTVLRGAGLQLTMMSTTDAVWMLSPMLLTLMASVLAPWSLSRVRHT
jgi:hypothetical protein